MATATSHGPLTAEQRQALRAEIDQTVRAGLEPPQHACPECGTDLRDRTTPVYGCTTCANRYWRRRQRAQSR